jgi:metal-responsive CopG/Arc/MetJ family transcriptional regulator
MMMPMRTIVDLPAEQLEALDALCRHEGISRAEGVRRAVADHVRAHQPSTRAPAFGLWKARREGGLAYQRRLRREWNR